MSSRLAPLRTPQLQQRLLGCFAAVHASGPEEDNGVLDVLFLESTGWLEILRQDAKGTGVSCCSGTRDSRKRAAAGWTCRKNCIIFGRRRCRPSTASPAVRRRVVAGLSRRSLSEGGTTKGTSTYAPGHCSRQHHVDIRSRRDRYRQEPRGAEHCRLDASGRCRRQEESAADRRKASRDRESRVQGQV